MLFERRNGRVLYVDAVYYVLARYGPSELILLILKPKLILRTFLKRLYLKTLQVLICYIQLSGLRS